MKDYPLCVSDDLVRRLLKAGCPLDVSDDVQGNPAAARRGLLICQAGAEVQSTVFDLHWGVTGYMIELHIGSDLPGQLTIWDWELRLPWQDLSLHWLEDPCESGSPGAPYKFPGRAPLEFDRKLVINHRRRLSRGGSIDGLLLGTGMEPIPGTFGHGNSITAELALVDQIGRKFWSPISLWTDRSARRHKGEARKRTRSRLFEEQVTEARIEDGGIRRLA